MNVIKRASYLILALFLFNSSAYAMELKGNGFTLDLNANEIQTMEAVTANYITFSRFDNKTVSVKVFDTNPIDPLLTIFTYYPQNTPADSVNIVEDWLSNIKPKDGTLVFRERLERKMGLVYGLAYKRTNMVTCAYLRGKKAYIVDVFGSEPIYILKTLALDTLDSLYPR
ncbi:MAG: hypothetical protein VB133_08470 [Anaeromusa sp.]|uniref:hypothetical protein n=1 Tax=Anaeromusa sp. TaxID=1872520 RepID=UPI002B20969C|nr:hypothetical protein [Anaeromusa sp.]MEA4835154.1 hypothetical protein [Anaeromusa sp.]